MTCSVVDGQGKRGNVHIPAIMSVDFPDVVFDGFIQLWNSLFLGGNRTPESDKKADTGISHQTENEEHFVYVPGTWYVYIPCCCYVVMADTKREDDIFRVAL